METYGRVQDDRSSKDRCICTHSEGGSKPDGRNAVSRVWARVLAAGAYMHLGRRLGYVLRNSGPQLGLFSHMIESLSMESSHRTSILGSEGHR